MQQKGQLLSKFTPKRGFSSGGGSDFLNRMLETIVRLLPGGNVGLLMVALNTLCYFLYLTWPRHLMFSYLNNFTFSKFNLDHGRLHTFFTSHFTHMGFFSYLLDTVILYLFCNNLSMMYGPIFVLKSVLMSIFLADFLLFL